MISHARPSPEIRGFWSWLFAKDDAGDRGINNLFDIWNGAGVVVSGVVAYFGNIAGAELATNIALPAAAALVGLSFAWAGRSSSLLQDKDFSKFIIRYGPSSEGYVYSFQLAILTVFSLISVSIVLAAGVKIGTTHDVWLDEAINRYLISFFGWLAARECWGAITFANKLSLQLFWLRSNEMYDEDAGYN